LFIFKMLQAIVGRGKASIDPIWNGPPQAVFLF
jgi:hypothetical protein